MTPPERAVETGRTYIVQTTTTAYARRQDIPDGAWREFGRARTIRGLHRVQARAERWVRRGGMASWMGNVRVIRDDGAEVA